jgi:hypothetical protein
MTKLTVAFRNFANATTTFTYPESDNCGTQFDASDVEVKNVTYQHRSYIPMLVLQVAAHTMHFFYPRRTLRHCRKVHCNGDNSDIYQRAGRRKTCESWVYEVTLFTEGFNIYNTSNTMVLRRQSTGVNNKGDLV